LILIIPLFFIWSMILPSLVAGRVGEMGDSGFGGRADLWIYSIKTALSHPFLGVGFGSIVNLGPQMFPHNIYLLVAAEMGLIGLGLFLFIILSCLKDEWNLLKIVQDKWTEGIILGILGYTVFLLAGQFFGQSLRYFPFSAYFWILTGLAMRLNLLEKQRMEEGRIG